MRRKWMVLALICYIVTAAPPLPIDSNTAQLSQGSENSTVNSQNSEGKSEASPASADLDNSGKDSKTDDESDSIVDKTITEGDSLGQDNSSKPSSSDSTKQVAQTAGNDQPDVDKKNVSSQSTGQVNDPGAASPESQPASSNTSNENEQVNGDNSDDGTLVSETGDNPAADKTEDNNPNADSQTADSDSDGIKSSVIDPKDNSNVTDGSKGSDTVDEDAKPLTSDKIQGTPPSASGNAGSENEESAAKEQGLSGNAPSSAIDDSKVSKLPLDDNKSSPAPIQGDDKDTTIPADQEDVDDSQPPPQKQNVNSADGDDFENYYQDDSKYDSKSSMDGSVPQAGPSYDDTDVEDPVPRGGQQQYDDKQSFISSGGQNQKIGGQFTDDEDSHFFAYFLTIMVTAIIFYLVFHNKQRIIALIIEGRAPRNGRSRRSSSRAKYHKLDNNLEEAITATKGSKGQ